MPPPVSRLVSLLWAREGKKVAPGGSNTNAAGPGWCGAMSAFWDIKSHLLSGKEKGAKPAWKPEGQQDSLFLFSNAMHIPHLKAISSLQKDSSW